MNCTNCGADGAKEYNATLGSAPTRELCKECLPLMKDVYGITGRKVQETDAKDQESEPEEAPRRRRG